MITGIKPANSLSTIAGLFLVYLSANHTAANTAARANNGCAKCNEKNKNFRGIPRISRCIYHTTLHPL